MDSFPRKNPFFHSAAMSFPFPILSTRAALLSMAVVMGPLICPAGADSKGKTKEKAGDGRNAPARAAATPDPGPDAEPPTPSRKDIQPEVLRAIAAMRAGQWQAARDSWQKVTAAEPENAGALSNLGKVQFQLGDFPAAQSTLEKATILNPALADAWITLGLTYMEREAPMRAVSCLTRGVAENPADPGAHNSLAIVLKRLGWTDGAESELQKALDLNPEYSEAHFNLAVMYLERKPPSLEMAGRHYRRAIELGAAPDTLVEKQIRGETVVAEEEEESSPDQPGAADRKAPVAAVTPDSPPVKKFPPVPKTKSPPGKSSRNQ